MSIATYNPVFAQYFTPGEGFAMAFGDCSYVMSPTYSDQLRPDVAQLTPAWRRVYYRLYWAFYRGDVVAVDASSVGGFENLLVLEPIRICESCKAECEDVH